MHNHKVYTLYDMWIEFYNFVWDCLKNLDRSNQGYPQQKFSLKNVTPELCKGNSMSNHPEKIQIYTTPLRISSPLDPG